MLALAAGAAALFNGALTARRLHWASPLTGWEAGMVVDGWRVLHHLPSYAADHATNMYGPLLNLSSGLLFYLTGVNNFTLRLFETACYLSAVAMVSFAVAPRGWRAISVGVLGIANLRTGVYWAMPNPDGAALLFTVAFVLLASGDRMVLASLALAVAVLFKQSSAAAALLPILAGDPRRSWRSLLPLAAVGVTFLALRTGLPLVSYYTFTVPWSYSYHQYRFAKAPIDTLVGLPVLGIALITWKPRWDRLERWLVSSMAVTAVAGTIMAAKHGGGLNSYMMFDVAALAFCCYLLPGLAMSPATVCAVGILLSAFADPAMSIGASGEHQGDATYPRVVTFAGTLSGKVVCPEDPTIPLYAKGYAGTSVNMEIDAAFDSAGHLPPRVRAELRDADWVLTTRTVFAGKWLNESELEAVGFRPVRAEALAGTSYTLWQRARSAAAGT